VADPPQVDRCEGQAEGRGRLDQDWRRSAGCNCPPVAHMADADDGPIDGATLSTRAIHIITAPAPPFPSRRIYISRWLTVGTTDSSPGAYCISLGEPVDTCYRNGNDYDAHIQVILMAREVSGGMVGK